VEIEVEKELGITRKAQIEEFRDRRVQRAMPRLRARYVDDFTDLTSRSGAPSIRRRLLTLDNTYIETVWWIVRQLWDKDLLYEDTASRRTAPAAAPHCRRTNSASPALPGRRRPVDLRPLPVVDDDVDLLVWTTTPWTLISNVAAAVSGDIEYVRVAPTTAGSDVVMAASRVDAVFGEGAQTVDDPFPGHMLVGARYQRPFDIVAMDERANASSPPTSSPPTSAPDRAPRARGSAPTTWTPPAPHDLPVINPSAPTARSLTRFHASTART